MRPDDRPATTATTTPARTWDRRLVRALTATALMSAAAAVVVAKPVVSEGPTRPAPRDAAVAGMHERFLLRAKQGDVDLLFLGDSITQMWENHPGLWDRHYAPRRAANFGVSGDRTQNVLWRIDHGELDGLRPRVVVVLIGTNNLPSDPPAGVAAGVAAVVARVRKKLPDSKVLLLGLLPRGRTAADQLRARLAAVNDRIARLADGKSVEYLDLGRHFLTRDGLVPWDVMPDALHLSGPGYRTWADAMEPTLWALMEGQAAPAAAPSAAVGE